MNKPFATESELISKIKRAWPKCASNKKEIRKARKQFVPRLRAVKDKNGYSILQSKFCKVSQHRKVIFYMIINLNVEFSVLNKKTFRDNHISFCFAFNECCQIIYEGSMTNEIMRHSDVRVINKLKMTHF